MINGESIFFIDRLTRTRSAKCIDTDDVVLAARIAGPARTDTCFDGNRRYILGKDAASVGCTLAVKRSQLGMETT